LWARLIATCSSRIAASPAASPMPISASGACSATSAGISAGSRSKLTGSTRPITAASSMRAPSSRRATSPDGLRVPPPNGSKPVRSRRATALQDELGQIGVLRQRRDLRLHVGGVDRDGGARLVGRREADLLEQPLHHGVE